MQQQEMQQQVEKSKNNNKNNPDVSIVIPTKNEEGNIGKCLEAIYEQKTDYQFDVRVIDSGSSDQTVDIVKKYPWVKLLEIPPESFGHGKTRNLGAELSTGDHLVFLNADAIPADKYWLNTLILPLIKDPLAAGTYSRHIPQNDCLFYMARDLLQSMPEESRVREKKRLLDFMIFSTVSCAIPRETWGKYPFDSKIIIAEDQQWASHVLKQGLKIVYIPASRVFHSHNYTPRELFVLKQKISEATPKFKTAFSARVVGFVLAATGMVIKILYDIHFILFKSNAWKKITFRQKLSEIAISFKARAASFAGRYQGWNAATRGVNHE